MEERREEDLIAAGIRLEENQGVATHLVGRVQIATKAVEFDEALENRGPSERIAARS